jgi:hypothetical protein
MSNIRCGNFAAEGKAFEDSRESRRFPDFQTRFRIEGAPEVSPNASVQDIAQTPGIASSTLFDVLTQVLRLEFCN